MKQCKYCQAELAENGTFCPVCGKNNDETIPEEVLNVEETAAPVEEAPAEAVPPVEIKEGKKASPAKIAIAVVAVVVLIALLIGLIAGGMMGKGVDDSTVPSDEVVAAPSEETVPATVPADGNPDDETCKGTYTVTDEEVMAAMDTVVATAGDYQLTNGELQVYYWLEVQSFLQQYGSYAMYFGLDHTQGLDTQVCGIMEGRTWQQFFLKNAIGTWNNYRAMAAEAELTDFQLDEEAQSYLDTLAADMEESALSYGFSDAKEMLAYNVGAGAEVEDYVNFMTDYYRGYQYYNSLCEEFDTSDPALEAYYQENEDQFAQNGAAKETEYVNVRHILIKPEGGTTDANGATTYSDEEWAAAQMKAQEILDQYLAGDKSEDSFAELANTHTADGNDANYDGIPDGGLYTDVTKGQMVPEFENWCFDDVRVTGDTGLVKTTYGWHVMYFVNSRSEENKFVDVRHILIIPEGGTVGENGATTYSDEEWAAAQLKAQDILDQYLAGDKTEESFGALANEHTADGNDVNYDGVPDGGLYTDVVKGQMVPEFEEWCFDDARLTGDTGLVKTTYGWHIMYYVDSHPVWKNYAENQLTMKLANELLAEIVAQYPLEVDYSAIKLGFVDMSA